MRAKVETEENGKKNLKRMANYLKAKVFQSPYGITDNKSVLAIFETDDLDKFNESI